MTDNAIKFSRATLKDRILMRRLVRELDRHNAEGDATPIAPPGPFRTALRQPIGSKRKPVTVTVGGRPVSLLLNPQGRIDVDREQWLWEYVRDLIEGDEES